MNSRWRATNRFGRPGLSFRERVFVVGGTAITFAALCLLAVVMYTQSEADAHVKVVKNENMQDVAFETLMLLAPISRVSQGTKLSSVIMKEVPWPRNEVPEGAVRSTENIAAMYARVDLEAGVPIIHSNLSQTPLLGGLADLIPPGHRAVTMEVDATTGVEGWATPGVHVDVLVTFRDSSDGKTKTQIAIEDAVVLSYNGQTRRDLGEESVRRLTAIATVTLAVPVMDAIKLHTARAMGKISLILRHTGDAKSVGTPEISSDDFKSDRPVTKSESGYLGNPQGFVRYTDSTGVDRELELRRRRWFEVGDGETE